LSAVDSFLDAQYRNAIQAQGRGASEVKIPLSIRQQGNLGSKKVISKIRVMVETERVEDAKRRVAMDKEKEGRGNTYSQNIIQHGGVMNASQTGNVLVNDLTVEELSKLGPALSEMRTFFKNQKDSLDADEYVGFLAGAEKAAGEKDESKMRHYLKQIPSKAWNIGQTVIPQILLHYLKLHGMV
jgi:hypothetical protein